MNNNETRTLWISIAAALLAVFLLYSYTQEKSVELTKKFGAKKRVVIATKDINEMETVDETMLQITERPVDFIEPSALKDPERAVGQVALAPIKKGEQILASKIMQPGPITGLALQVSPSKRAVTIPIDEMRGVAKLLKPGDRIDLVAALDVGKGPNQHKEVKTIMEDVIILATGLRIVNELPRLFEKVGREEFVKNMRGDTTFSNITIETTPKEAQDLIYILSTSPGSLFTTLRHPSDHSKKRNYLGVSTIDSVLNRVSRKTAATHAKFSRRPTKPTKPKKGKPIKKKARGAFIDL
ncbi:Flp pilus assembly protein CpaB [Bdellovibrionales bacterium]|nr:Flp pilus assembly protein CpaB [Bdellovibrionales bacterium]